MLDQHGERMQHAVHVDTGYTPVLFPVPPDLPANAASVDELAAYYRRLLGESGGKLPSSTLTTRKLLIASDEAQKRRLQTGLGEVGWCW